MGKKEGGIGRKSVKILICTPMVRTLRRRFDTNVTIGMPVWNNIGSSNNATNTKEFSKVPTFLKISKTDPNFKNTSTIAAL